MIEEAFNSNNVRWSSTKSTHFVHAIGVLFNCIYIQTTNLPSVTELIPFVTKIIRNLEISGQKAERVQSLLDILIRNTSTIKNIQFHPQRTSLEELLLNRLMFHFIAVVLAVPTNPFALLYHAPQIYQNGYLVGMPENAICKLLKCMEGHGLWC
jgi:hypothetical protein